MIEEWWRLKIDERQESKICKSCETLREQLTIERSINKELVKAVLPREEIAQQATEAPKPLQTRTIPWRVRQQMLEAEDMKAAQLLKQKAKEEIDNKKSTEQLEKELLEPEHTMMSLGD